MRRRAAFRIAVWTVIAAAFALRLIYGWAWPDARRFWDERYAFQNVYSIYEERTFEPVKSYYPSPVVNLPPALLVALSETLESWTGDGRWKADDADGIPPAAYRWARGLQALYGALAVLFVYLAGARLFGRAEGYLGGLVLAFTLWPIHSGGSFKPDAQLTAFAAAALWASAVQIERPDWKRGVVTGLTIALAASAKLTGVLVAAPVAVVALALGFSRRAQWWSLAVAGGASFAFFVALNPYWMAYPVYIRALRADYAPRAELSGMTRGQIPARAVEFVTSGEVLGWFLGVAALAALAVLAARALWPGRPAGERARAGLIVIFPLVFVAAYAAQTAYFKPNQFLPALPFLALALGWLAVAGWRWGLGASGRWDDRGYAGAAILAILTLAAAAHGARYVYQALVPTTLDLAKTALSRHPPFHQRHYLVEEAAFASGRDWERLGDPVRNRILVEPVSSLASVAEERLRLADGWIHPARRDDREGFYRALAERVDGLPSKSAASWRFAARRFHARGPDLAVGVVWPQVLPPVTAAPRSCGRGCLEGELPRRDGPREAVSFSIYVPYPPSEADFSPPRLEVDGEPVRLLRNRAWSLGRSFGSVRIPGRKRAMRWILSVADPPAEPPVVEIHRWRLWPGGEASAQTDVVGVGETLEPGQVDPGEKREGGDDQGDDD